MKIGRHFYSDILDHLNRLQFQETPGIERDLLFLSDEFWLQDTAVVEHITKGKGMYWVGLIFVHSNQPLRFLKRVITGYSDHRKASTSAHYMRRQAAKDQRGTLVINPKSLNFNLN
jgi:hypothetical protein